MRISVDIRGEDRFAARLDRIAERAGDLTPVYDQFVAELLRSGHRIWRDQPGWHDPEFADSTRRRKGRRGPMEVSGTLRKALTIKGAPGQLRDEHGLRFGLVTNGSAYYGKFHQAGKGVPRRLVLKPSRREQAAIRDDVREFLLGAR